TPGEPFYFTYGAGVADIDLRRLAAFHRSHGRTATVTTVRPPARFGNLTIEGDRDENFHEKPEEGEGWSNGGFFVLEPQAIDYIDGDASVWEREPIARLVQDGQLMGYRHYGFWSCMDTLKEKQLLEELWASGKAPWRIWDEAVSEPVAARCAGRRRGPARRRRDEADAGSVAPTPAGAGGRALGCGCRQRGGRKIPATSPRSTNLSQASLSSWPAKSRNASTSTRAPRSWHSLTKGVKSASPVARATTSHRPMALTTSTAMPRSQSPSSTCRSSAPTRTRTCIRRTRNPSAVSLRAKPWPAVSPCRSTT